MTESLSQTDLQRRAARYDSQDGIGEFLVGCLFFFIARAVVDPHLAWVPALLVFPLRWALRFFKERFTYPRAGYVKLQPTETGPELGRGMLLYLGVVVFIAAAVLVVWGDVTSWDQWMKWLPAVMGGFCSGAFLYLAQRSGLWRHYALFVASISWGVACSLLPARTVYEGIQHWALGLGLICVLTGIAVFAHFVRTHPVRDEEGADEHA
ncbi:MAG: hypothetical protein GY838_10835 [bacterium]|nr:hypothetical protein [bacterium]